MRPEIKRLTVQDLQRLTDKAVANSWSATGRPAWLREHAEQVKEVYLSVFCVEHDGVYRGLVSVYTLPLRGRAFILDLAVEEFEALPSLTQAELVLLAHRAMSMFPMQPLDPDQANTWRKLGLELGLPGEPET